MNATKRKFNALLQGIGTRSSHSVSATDKNADAPPSSAGSGAARDSYLHHRRLNDSSDMLYVAPALSSSDLDVLNKRRRIGGGGEGGQGGSPPTALKDTSGNVGSAISNIVLRKFSATRLRDEKPATTPRYCPGDREQLLRRLATFQELTDWTPKPDRVNEIEWAKKGWVCQGKERLRCTLCSKELVVKLNRKEVDGREVPVLVPSEIEDALVDKYAELMTTSHQEDCLWRKKGCDDTLLRLPLANPQTALHGLRQRYDELCARKDFLPYEFNLRLPDGFDLDAVLRNLPPNFFHEPPPAVLTNSSSPNRPALALALLGWQGLTNARIGPVPNSASCQSCLRRLGLWMFKSKQVDLETGTILVPAPMDHLDPVREHRFFCPWKNGAVQRNPGGGARSSASSRTRARTGSSGSAEHRAGWEVLVQVIKNDAYLRNRTSVAAAARTGLASRDSGPLTAPAAAPSTTSLDHRPGTAGTLAGSVLLVPEGHDIEMEDEAVREAKDKERWARLRKVKSLFDTKGGKKLKRPVSSRPGTGHSTLRPDSSRDAQ